MVGHEVWPPVRLTGGGTGHDDPRVVRPGPSLFMPMGPSKVTGQSVANGEADMGGEGTTTQGQGGRLGEVIRVIRRRSKGIKHQKTQSQSCWDSG